MPDTATLSRKHLDQFIARMAADGEVVELAKADPLPTTRHDYGGYMTKIVRLAQNAPIVDGASEASQAKVWSLILIKAGGDVQGIVDALKVSYNYGA